MSCSYYYQSYFKMRNGGSEKLSNLSKITEQGQGLVWGLELRHMVLPSTTSMGVAGGPCLLEILSSHVPCKFSQCQRIPPALRSKLLTLYYILTPV